MFNRQKISYHEQQIKTKENLKRFDNDEYAAKYLFNCYNPEFKMRMTKMKDKPKMRKNYDFVFSIYPNRKNVSIR
jgi:hypothetical protein